MKTAKLFLTITLLSFGFSTLPMEYNSQENEKQEQKESTQEQKIPSLKNLSLNATADKILFPICEQATAGNLENKRQEINNILKKLPTELHDEVKGQFSENHGWQLDLLARKMDIRKILNLPEDHSIVGIRANDKGQLACQISEKEIVIIDCHTEKIIDRITMEHTPHFWYFGSNNTLICICNDNTIIDMYDLTKNKIKKIPINNSLSLLTITPDEKFMAGLEEDKQTIHIWNSKTGKQILTITEPNITYFTFFPHSYRLLTISGEFNTDNITTCKIWDIFTGEKVYTIEDYFQPLFDISSKEHLAYYKINRGELTFPIIHPTACVTILNVETNKQVVCKIPENEYRIASLTFSPDASFLFARGKNLHIFDTKTGNLLHTFAGTILKRELDENYYYFTKFWYTHNNNYLIVLAQPLETHYNDGIDINTRIQSPPSIVYVFDTKTWQCLQQIPIELSDMDAYIRDGLFLKNKINFIEDSKTAGSSLSCHPETLDMLPLEYALKDAESKDDDESRQKAQQLREQIKKFYPDKSESKDTSNSSKEEE